MALTFPAQQLRADLQACGLTPPTAARQAGLKPGTVRRWLSGHQPSPSPRHLGQLLDACGIRPGPYRAWLTPRPRRPGRRRSHPPFPREQFLADLKARGLTVEAAARQAGMWGQTVRPWTRGEHPPTPRLLRQILEANSIPLDPYQPWLESLTTFRAFCPICEKTREVERFRGARRDRQEHLPGRPDGSYELLCRRHAAKRVGLRNRPRLKRIQRERLKAALGERAHYVAEAAAQDDQQADQMRKQALTPWFLDAVAPMRHRPPSQEARRKLGVALMVAHALKAFPQLRLCLLCGLVVHKDRWHRVCGSIWKKPSVLSRDGEHRPRGRPADRNLGRNYSWLMASRAGRRTRRELFPEGKKPAVTAAIDAFIRRLPGSWNLVFLRETRRRGNPARQALVSLPQVLQPLIDRGARDSLIRQLYNLGMSEKPIARLTGASPERVRGVVSALLRPWKPGVPDLIHAVEALARERQAGVTVSAVARRLQVGRDVAERLVREAVAQGRLRDRREGKWRKGRLAVVGVRPPQLAAG